MNPNGTVNWLYVFATLGIRFVGVFIVLAILQVSLSLASKIIARFVSKKPETGSCQ